MRGFAIAFGIGALLALVEAAALLLSDTPAPSDVTGFAALGIALIFAFIALCLVTRPSWWQWWIGAIWIGLDIAALFLAYSRTFWAEAAYFGPIQLAQHIAIHVLIAPIEVFFAFVVGFADPTGWIIVLACVAVAILGAEIIRRRTWPQRSRVASSTAQE